MLVFGGNRADGFFVHLPRHQHVKIQYSRGFSKVCKKKGFRVEGFRFRVRVPSTRGMWSLIVGIWIVFIGPFLCVHVSFWECSVLAFLNLGLPSGSLGLGKLLDPLQQRLAMALTSAVGFFPCDKMGRYCLGTLNPKSQTLNPNTPNPRPNTLNPEP